MAAPGSGPTKRKFTNDDVMACFTEEHRRQVGKIELSAAEITEILNEQVLEDTEVTRQAVSKRLKDLEGDKIQRHQHGRSHLYTLEDDLDRLFREPEPVTSGPAPGGSAGGGEPPQEQIDRSAQLQDTTGILGKVKQGLRSRYNHHPVITGSIGFGFVLALLSFAGLSGTVVLQPQALGLMLLFLATYLVGFTVAASAAIWLLFKQAKVWQEQPTTGTTPSESTL